MLTKTAKHTPGPWEEYEPDVIIGNVDGGYGDDGRGVRYTEICELLPCDELAANRALIIAAPEMLEALKYVRAYFTKLEEGLPDTDPLTELRKKYHGPILLRMDAVIRKAEGN